MNGLSEVKLFLFDMDGTIYLGRRVFEFTVPLLKFIKGNGLRYMFVTNNASKNACDYAHHLNSLGIPADDGDFVTSAQATALYLKENFADGLIYSAGTRSFKDGLVQAGLNITDRFDENAVAVVNAYDTELTFEKLDTLCRLLTLKKDIPYIATNPDTVCPTEYGYVPDCGAVSEMIYEATGRKPKFIGKPNPEMIELAMKKAKVTREQTLVIGDRLYTDILSGINAGTKTLLVLSGESTLETLEKSNDKPTWVMRDCGELLKELNEIYV